MRNSSSAINITKEFVWTAELIGVKQVREVLKNAREKATSESSTDESTAENRIIRIICQAYSVSKRELIYGSSRGMRTEALTACFICLEKYLKYKGPRLELLFQKDQSNIRKAIKFFNLLSDKHDQKIISRVKNCQEKIEKELSLK